MVYNILKYLREISCIKTINTDILVIREINCQCKCYLSINYKGNKKMINSIMTIMQSQDGWCVIALKGDHTSEKDMTLYKDKIAAEVAAKAIAEEKGRIYVAPLNKFISVYPLGKSFIAVEVTANGQFDADGVTINSNFLSIASKAIKIAEEKQLPFEPHFFV